MSSFARLRPVLLLAPLVALAATAITAATASEALLARSIAYHDPNGVWGEQALLLSFDESRPDGPQRQTRVTLDPRHQRFDWWSRRGDDLLEGSLDEDECTVTFNGSTDIPETKREQYRLDCERIVLYRDYYTYLWGLPMKLRDPGTRLDPDVEDTDFNGRQVRAIRVTYDPEVGNDIWYFYFAPDSAALVGYRFYHDEPANDGEYVVLEGETGGAGLKLPQARTWYTNAEDRLLATDTLIRLATAEE